MKYIIIHAGNTLFLLRMFNQRNDPHQAIRRILDANLFNSVSNKIVSIFLKKVSKEVPGLSQRCVK